MNKLVLILCSCLVFNLCSKIDFNEFEVNDNLSITLPKQVEEFGKSVADEVYFTMSNLCEKGISYSDADASEEFKHRFYTDYCNASSTFPKTRALNYNDIYEVDSHLFIKRMNLLTEVQLKFIDRIIKECSSVRSHDFMRERLRVITSDIYSNVPEIEQERLLKIVSVLYYTSLSLQKLENQGLFVETPNSSFKRIRTRSNEDFGSYCRQIVATVWTIAVGEPTVTGEIVASIVTVIVGATLLYEIIVCSDETNRLSRQDCIDLYESCRTYSYSYKERCDDCLQYCITQGIWPRDRCDWIYSNY